MAVDPLEELAAKHGGVGDPAANPPQTDPLEALAAKHGGVTDVSPLQTALTPRPLVDTHLKVFPGESSGSVPGDFVLGGVSSAAQLPIGGYNLLRKGIPSLPALPESLQSWAVPPDNTAGHLGEFAGDAATFMAPGGAEEKILGKLAGGKLLRVGARAGLDAATAGAIEGVKSGGDPAKTGAAALGAGVTGGALEGAGKPLLRLVTDLWGKATGAGGEAIRTAASQASDDYLKALRYKTNENDIVQSLRDATKEVMTKRGDAYRAGMAGLDQSIHLDQVPVMHALQDQLRAYKINVLAGKNLFNSSPIVNKEDRVLFTKAIGDVGRWVDNTPAGMDILKQRLTGYANDASGQAQPFFYRIADNINQSLRTNVPGYAQVTGDYGKASELLQAVNKEFSANAANPGVAMRKLSYIFNQNNDFRKVLLESLDNAAGSHLKDTLAGYSLRTPVARGLAGVVAGSSAYLHNPAILSGLALSSPRLAGEAMALLSVLRRNTPEAIKRLPISGVAPAISNQILPNELTPPPNR